MSVSIVVPLHNEARDLPRLARRFVTELKKRADFEVFEIILSENGSSDGTSNVCSDLAEGDDGPFRALSIPKPSYGEAVRRGVMEAAGSQVTILEIDCMDVPFTIASVNIIEGGEADLVIASKRHPLSIDNRPRCRRLITWGFNQGLRLATGYPGTDTHGLKTLSAPLAKQLCSLSTTSGEAFQTELVLLAWRMGFRVTELPLAIEEVRSPPISVAGRIPKAMGILRALRRSLSRLEDTPGGRGSVTQLTADGMDLVSGR